MSGPNKRETLRRAPDAAALVMLLEQVAGQPLHRQIYNGLRDAIMAGRLLPGGRLPSTRSLADDLGVARNTVALAFDQLRTEGYLVTRRGGGTRVRAATPETLLNSPARRLIPALRTTPQSAAVSVRLPARGAALVAEGRAHVESPRPRAFQLGVPAIDLFPVAIWARLSARRWRRGSSHLHEGLVTGDPDLRAAIAAHVINTRGVRCTPDQVFVVNGAQHAVDMISRILLDRGDEVWMEDPGYLHARIAVRDAGAHILPVPVDDQGMIVTEGERIAPNARLAYVTPSHQFPLGVVMSAPRRLALLAWAHRAQAWIIEDDYDSEFRYSGRPLPSLQGLDVERSDPAGQPRVLYVGTFSKSLAPGFRLGYLIVPDALIDTFKAARRALDRYAPTLEQGVLADFIADGHYARHVRRARALYAERQDVLLHAARTDLDGLIRLAPDPAGLHLVGWLPDGVNSEAVATIAAAEGVDTSPLSRYRLHVTTHDQPALLLNYAGFDEKAIRSGVRCLQRALLQ